MRLSFVAYDRPDETILCLEDLTREVNTPFLRHFEQRRHFNAISTPF